MNKKIERDARVVATDGELGRVKHVVVDPETREVTELVVEQDEREWLIPIGAVAGVEGGRVMLRARRSQFQGGNAFDRDHFHAVDDEAAERESARHSARGGAPLMDADDDAVVVGETAGTVERQRGTSRRDDGGNALQLREEELLAHKERVETGEVLIGTEVVTEERTLEVPVTREEVTVERRRVQARPSDAPIGEDETIEVSVYQEDIEVEKRPIIYEEVSVGKRQVQQIEQVSDTIRREEAVVQARGDVDVDDSARR